MILAEEISFESEIQENICVEDIRKEYSEGIIIWLNGSGTSPDGKSGSYRCVLDYRGHVKFMERQLPGATANQTMIIGAIDAIQCINKPLRVYLISPAALGFVNGFKGKGPNGSLIQQLCECIKEKDCQLTEVQFINGGNEIKKFIYSCNPDKAKMSEYEKQQNEKQKSKEMYREKYKESIYNECLLKVIQVLTENGVDNSLIEMIREIRP